MADISITAANVVPSANATLIQGVAGEAVTRGQTLYYDSAAGTYKKFDANDTAKDTLVGLACEDAAAGQPLIVCTKDPALALGGTVAIGDTVWGSATAGGLTKTFADLVTGWRVYVVGVANAANTINFDFVRGGIIP
jgi:hypothetical protein